MDARCTSEGDEPVCLEWRTGLAGCLSLVGFGAAALFYWWAINPADADLDGDTRGATLVRGVAGAIGTGWTCFLFALVCGWLAVRMGWRFARPMPLRAGQSGLELHGMFGDTLVRWSEVRHVKLSTDRRPVIEIGFSAPQRALESPLRVDTFRLGGLDLDNEAGARFVEAANRWMATA